MSRNKELFDGIAKALIGFIRKGEAGEWGKPWTAALASAGRATNPTTGAAYRGVNRLTLGIKALGEGWPNLWAGYKQWLSVEGQVQKGETGTLGVKWGVIHFCDTCGTKGQKPCPVKEHAKRTAMFARPFKVFNAAQQRGWTPPKVTGATEPERHARAEALVKATGADVRHVAGDRAYHRVGSDLVVVPERVQFDTPEGYYGTLLHEVTHWTGQRVEPKRDQEGAFGTALYAQEELTAELGAAFLGGALGIEPEPSREHAAYMANWLQAISDDSAALYRAARDADKAADYVLALEGSK